MSVSAARLRPFAPSDTASVVAVINRAAPEFPLSPAAYRDRDAHRPAHCQLSRFVAEADGEIVGVGEIHQRPDMYSPGRFLMALYVRPDWQNRGVGGALYDALANELRARGAESVRAFAREDRPGDVRFFEKRGHAEVMRDGGAFLPLDRFDPADWAEAETRLTRFGLHIISYADLAKDADRDHKLWSLFNAILADVPPRGERTPVDFDTFVQTRLNRTGFLPDALFLAVTPGGEYIAAHQLLIPPSAESDVLSTGLTGVLPEWRRKGVALALKVRGLRAAREKGAIQTVKTWNASDNLPVLQLNERLLFEREPWRLHFLKTF